MAQKANWPWFWSLVTARNSRKLTYKRRTCQIQQTLKPDMWIPAFASKQLSSECSDPLDRYWKYVLFTNMVVCFLCISVICFLQNHSRTKTQLNENSKIRNLWEKNGFLQDLLSCLQGCLSFQPENFFQTLRQSSPWWRLNWTTVSRKPAFFSLTQIRIQLLKGLVIHPPKHPPEKNKIKKTVSKNIKQSSIDFFLDSPRFI